MRKEDRAPYEFSAATKTRVRLRQDGKCAVCGNPLDLSNTTYHHVVAAQSARLLSISKELIRHENNCVALCRSDEYNSADSCHFDAHNGNWKTGGLMEGPFFKYSHGKTRQGIEKHKQWCKTIDAIWATRNNIR